MKKLFIILIFILYSCKKSYLDDSIKIISGNNKNIYLYGDDLVFKKLKLTKLINLELDNYSNDDYLILNYTKDSFNLDDKPITYIFNISKEKGLNVIFYNFHHYQNIINQYLDYNYYTDILFYNSKNNYIYENYEINKELAIINFIRNNIYNEFYS